MWLLLRFVIGGIIVSVFAVLGDVLNPRSFAGLFGAAPSVALATLTLTISRDGKLYASTEARSMIVGAAALLIYTYSCARMLAGGRWSAALTTLGGLLFWAACAFGGWLFVLR